MTRRQSSCVSTASQSRRGRRSAGGAAVADPACAASTPRARLLSRALGSRSRHRLADAANPRLRQPVRAHLPGRRGPDPAAASGALRGLRAAGRRLCAPVFAHGRAIPPGFDADGSLVRVLRSRTTPLGGETSRHGRGLALDPFERAALETLGATVVDPIHVQDLAAFVVLAGKRSGDVSRPPTSPCSRASETRSPLCCVDTIRRRWYARAARWSRSCAAMCPAPWSSSWRVGTSRCRVSARSRCCSSISAATPPSPRDSRPKRSSPP